ncbi:hypothetical protein ROZALSC1DRAFT_26125, partial [Rozella allomycis CSF55]
MYSEVSLGKLRLSKKSPSWVFCGSLPKLSKISENRKSPKKSEGRVRKRNLGDIQLKIQETESNISIATINFISNQIFQFISMLKLHEELQISILNMDSDQEKNFPWFLLKINSSSLEDLTVKNVRK